MAAAPPFGYLSADVMAESGVSESYLGFLVRSDIVRPVKHRNGRTNLFSEDNLETVRWAMARRDELTVEEMRLMVNGTEGGETATSVYICPAVTQDSDDREVAAQ